MEPDWGAPFVAFFVSFTDCFLVNLDTQSRFRELFDVPVLELQVTGVNKVVVKFEPLVVMNSEAHLLNQMVLRSQADCENKELAKDFIRWFVTEEAQTLIRPSMGAGTLATDAPLSADFLAANPWAETYVAAGSGSRSPLIVGFELRSQEIHQIILEAVERVITQGQDPAEALAEAQAAAQ